MTWQKRSCCISVDWYRKREHIWGVCFALTCLYLKLWPEHCWWPFMTWNHHHHALWKSRAINKICRAVQKHSVLISRHRSHHPYMHTSHITNVKHPSHTRRPPPSGDGGGVPTDPMHLHRCSVFSNARWVRFAQFALLQTFIVVRNALNILYTYLCTIAITAGPGPADFVRYYSLRIIFINHLRIKLIF